jgi:hypothetical protein
MTTLWKCLNCGRDKFMSPNCPHVCNGIFRKHHFLKSFVKVEKDRVSPGHDHSAPGLKGGLWKI